MRVDPASADDIEYVALNMRERDYREFSALSHTESRQALAEILSKHYTGRDGVFCGHRDGSIWIGMAICSRPNVITLGFLATDRFSEVALSTTRFVRDLLHRYEAAGVHRIEAVSMDGYRQTHRWLRTLGLRPETGPLQGYGRGREAFVMFSRVRDANSSGE